MASQLQVATENALDEALEQGDAEALSRLMGVSLEEAQAVVGALAPVSDETLDRLAAPALESYLGRALKNDLAVASSSPDGHPNAQSAPRNVVPLKPAAAETRSQARRWPRFAAALAPLAAAGVLLAVFTTESAPTVGPYHLRPLALGESLTKAAPAVTEAQPIVWRQGSTFHVRLEPVTGLPVQAQENAAANLTAQVFLRSAGRTVELPLTVSHTPQGLDVKGVVGRTFRPTPGLHELVIAVVPEGHKAGPVQAADWERGAARTQTHPLFWFQVSVKP